MAHGRKRCRTTAAQPTTAGAAAWDGRGVRDAFVAQVPLLWLALCDRARSLIDA